MKEKLIIYNFGPIESVDLDLGKITVLIGEQATGKSTIAKVLAICRYFSYIVDDSKIVNYKSSFSRTALLDWGLGGFETKESYIYYENKDYQLKILNDKVTFFAHNEVKEESQIETPMQVFRPKIYPFSERFKQLYNNYQELKSKPESDFGISSDWHIPHSFLTTDVKKIMNNPFYFPTERGLQSVFSLGKSSIQNLSDSLYNQFALLDDISKKFKSEIEIEPLGIFYKNENGTGYFKDNKDGTYYKLSQAASGYKTAIPIALAVKYYNENEKRSRTFIIEEPEQNLFPSTQKKLVEFLVASINEYDNQFLLPTHSPYILTTLSNLIYAHKIGNIENGKYENKVHKVIPKKEWIDANDVSIYYLNKGIAKNIVDVDECIINLDDLDNVSEIINKEFDELLNIEVKNNSNE